MLAQIHAALVATHVVFGAAALVLFWLPIATRKGSDLHRRAGRLFLWSMYVVTGTAVATSLLVLAAPLTLRAPEGALDAGAAQALVARSRASGLFLLMLALLVLAALRQGWLALAAARAPTRLRSPLHLGLLGTLAVAGAASVWVGWQMEVMLLLGFGVGAVVAAGRLSHEALCARPPAGGWTVVHLRGMFVGGIGAYTAFFVFGGSRLLAGFLSGSWALLPWVLPSVVGAVLIRQWRRKVERSAAAEGAAAAGARRGVG